MSERACPRLIEVALPIRETSAESVRDKSPRQGHIPTLPRLGIIQDPISRLSPEMLYRQIQYHVEEGDWAQQGEEVPLEPTEESRCEMSIRHFKKFGQGEVDSEFLTPLVRCAGSSGSVESLRPQGGHAIKLISWVEAGG